MSIPQLRNAMSLNVIYSFSPLYTNLWTTNISHSFPTAVASSSFSTLSFFYNISLRHNQNVQHTFFSIPLTRKAPLRSVFIINLGLFHLTLLTSSSSVTFLSHTRAASPLLHFPPFPIIKSSDGSPGRFLLTFLTVDCKFTVLKPSLRFVFRSVRLFSSFWERDVKGGVVGLVGGGGRAGASTT